MFTLPGRLIGTVHHIARVEARAPALWRARLRAGEAETRIVMRNVSRSGFMGIGAIPIPAGSEVTLTLPFGAPVAADVRWSLNGRIGCRLRGRFDRRQLAFLMLCGGANALFTGAGLRVLFVLGCVGLLLIP
ncbi:PilZ domain-containing protein [Sphingosinicella sp.]|uniref:PilZ domain-containing protein n=1 Tax=Sphingosinicella sp. TaxID=1917971 RepID=UPI004037D6BE